MILFEQPEHIPNCDGDPGKCDTCAWAMTCPACGGSGGGPDPTLRCPHCHGTGEDPNWAGEAPDEAD